MRAAIEPAAGLLLLLATCLLVLATSPSKAPYRPSTGDWVQVGPKGEFSHDRFYLY